MQTLRNLHTSGLRPKSSSKPSSMPETHANEYLKCNIWAAFRYSEQLGEQLGRNQKSANFGFLREQIKIPGKPLSSLSSAREITKPLYKACAGHLQARYAPCKSKKSGEGQVHQLLGYVSAYRPWRTYKGLAMDFQGIAQVCKPPKHLQTRVTALV